MNTQSEFEFLKDQVERLNGVLSHYHDNMTGTAKAGSNPLKLELNNHIAPLLAEYDRIIVDLRGHLKRNEEFVEEEQGRVAAVIEENERLWQQVSHKSDQGPPKRVSDSTDNLQRQLDSLTREKKTVEELLSVCEAEVVRLQAVVTEHDMKPQTLIFNERMEEAKRQYQGTLSALEVEVGVLRDAKRDLTIESGRLRQQCSEMEKDNSVLVQKLRFEKEAAEESTNQLRMSLKRIEYLDDEKRELLRNMDEMRVALRGVESSRSEWGGAMEGLQVRYQEKEQQVFEGTQRLREAAQAMEEAQAEKRAAEMREAQAAGECERLRALIGGILEDAGLRTREEVDAVREGCEREVERVVEELNLCEQNRQELLAEIDQMKRSKTQLEQEMEMFQRAERERSLQEMSSSEASHERMIRAERDRESLRLQSANLETALQRETTDKQRMRDNFENEVGELQKKVAQLEAAVDRAQGNADRFAKLFNSSEETANNSRKKYQESLKKARHDYELLKQAFQIKQMEYETRLASTEDKQRNTTAEMRQILHRQQQLSSKWKEESHSLTNQYEDRLSQMSKELERQKLRNNEIVILLQESKQRILESKEIIEEKEKKIDLLRNRLSIVDDDGFTHSDCGQADGGDSSDSRWRLRQLKQAQRQQVRESVARGGRAGGPSDCD